MKKLIFIFTILFSYSIYPQQMRLLSSNIHIDIPKKNNKLVLDPLPAGTYTVGTNGDFSTIDSAFNKLSIDGIAGPVTLELIDTFYTAPTNETGFLLNGPIPGANPNNNISIIHGIDKNVTIEGNGNSVLTFMNTSYVTLGAIDFGRYRPGGITIHALHNTQFNHNGCINFVNNSDNNVVQNITIINEDNERVSGGIVFIALNSSPFECPDSNLITNNFIKKAAWGIYVEGSYGIPRGKGNIIRGNFIGSETDSLIGWGIQLVYCQNTLVENNIIQNLKQTVVGNDIINVGINSYWGSGDTIRNNIVQNIKSNSGYTSTGIQLSGVTGNVGNNNQVYNNMVYDIQSTSTQSDSRVAGIQLWAQNNPKIYYNSVYLSGNGANRQGSAALYIYGGFGNSTNVEVKNNIFVNTRDENQYCASAIYDYSTSNLTSDNNDFYYDDTNQNNCMIRIGGTTYNTLADWQIASGQDANSVSKEVFFVSSTDLHLTGSSDGDVDLIGTPIAGITTDIDGEDRGALYPYIGADEGTIPLPVELTSFTAISHLGKVILNWSTATEINNLGFEIERKIINNKNNGEWITVGFREGYGTTTDPKEYSFVDNISGICSNSLSYRLKQIDFDGSFEYSKEVLISNPAPIDFMLQQNYPNPFNPSTKIRSSVPQSSKMVIKVFDILGNEIETLVNEEKPAGTYEVEFNATDLPSGVYFYQLQAGSFVETKKMVLLR